MTSLGRLVRLVAPPLVLVVLLIGTFWGDDDNFPFGPFRMYSTKQEVDDEIRILELRGRIDGIWDTAPMEDFGLRRADLEGQLGKQEMDPHVVLTELAESYERLHDSEPPYEALQLGLIVHQLEGGRPVSEEYRELATEELSG